MPLSGRQLAILVSIFAAAAGAQTADSSCNAALDSMVATMKRDYPGYHEKADGRLSALVSLTDSIRLIARKSDDYRVCIPALQRYARFFRDPHIVGPWQAAPPSPQPQIAPGVATAPEDHARPTIRFLNDSTLVLQIPDFGLEYKAEIDSLIVANRSRLGRTPYMIIDVRGNSGGCSCSYVMLTPLLYTNPFRIAGSDVLASPANIQYYEEQLASDLPDSDKARIREAITRMHAKPNEFVELSPDRIVTQPAVYPMPKRIGVLFDASCASSCEGFVIEAQQSSKVALLGTANTRGVADYGNIRTVSLPGWRRMRIPTSRSRGERIDFVGIAPHVRLTPDVPDPLAFVTQVLTATARAR